MRETVRSPKRALRYDEKCRLRRSQLDDAVHELIAACLQVGGVREIYAYGSYARDTIGAESDLDAIIVRETDKRKILRDDDIRLLLRASVGFDLLVVTPHEFQNVMPNNPIGRHILNEAKLLLRIDRDTSERNAC